MTTLESRHARGLAALLIAAAVAGCNPTPSPPAPTSDTTVVATAPVTFVNKVWKVESSNAVAPGQLYTFLSEGTLVVASHTGIPSLGKWEQTGDSLFVTEEGIRYPADMLTLEARKFVIRINSPGTPVEMTLVPAE